MYFRFKGGEDFVFRGCEFKSDKPFNKEAANDAFKKCKKEILDVFLAENGFYKWKTAMYVRLDETGLLQVVELEKSRFDSIAFWVTFRVQPLYIPNLDRIWGINDRLGYCIYGRGDIRWYYADYETAKTSFENIRDGIKIYLLPWFDEFCAEENFRKRLMEKGPSKWLKALERSEEERKAAMLDNIERLKLPKKLAQKVLA